MEGNTRIIEIDPEEVQRYARAIARIVERDDPLGSEQRERAVNTYGAAFQLLVMRRGAEYGRALALAASNEALALVAEHAQAEALVAGEIAEIHERVCLMEEAAPDDAPNAPD